MPRKPSQILLAIGMISFVGTMALWWLGNLPGHFVPEVGREVFGNIGVPLQAMFYIGVSGFLAVMFYLFSLRAENWERGAPDRRTGHWRARVSRLVAGLGMKTLNRDRAAGMMHSLIYWGFVVLFLGTVTLEIDHLLPIAWKFLEGTTYQVYSAILDLAAVAYLGGLLWALARRYGQRPWRLRSKTKPEDGLILGVLALIGISGLLTEAARIAVDGPTRL